MNNDYLKNWIDKNKLYIEGITVMNATIDLEENENILNDESQKIRIILIRKNMSFKYQINKLLK